MKIEINNISKCFNEEIIFEDFNLELNDDKINCIIGASGCGKSTLLNMISGLLPYDKGNISGVQLKDISYVFQDDRLIDHLTVYDNLKITLKKYYSKDSIENEIDNLLKMVGIYEIKNKYPYSLSGGMKQRVNIARAFGKPSKIILMDEPFKSLDYKLKYTIIDDFMNVLELKKRMVIVVTHDIDEAFYFKGNIYVLGSKPVKVKGIFDAQIDINRKDILELI